MKWSVTLADRLGPEILTVRNIGTSFASCAVTFKGSLLVVSLRHFSITKKTNLKKKTSLKH